MAVSTELKYIPVEIKEVREDGTFTGIASKYGEEDLGGDVIDKGAFTKTISENPVVPILWQHKSDEVIGSGQMKEWGNKVTIDGKLDLEDPTAVKAHKKMKGGLVKGLSIGFSTVKHTWEEVEGRTVRHISELKLWEVSVVTFPMLPAAQVTRVKSEQTINAEVDPKAIADAVLEQIMALQANKGAPVEPPKVKEPPVKPNEPDIVHSGATALLQILRG